MKSYERTTAQDSEFDPRTITYTPTPGAPTPARSREQLLEGTTLRGLELETVPHGYMAKKFGQDGSIYTVHVWDSQGRLQYVDWPNSSIQVTDRTGNQIGEQSPLFSNTYEYDQIGRLTRFAQIVTQNDLTTYVYREDLHQYDADGSYASSHNEYSSDPMA